MGCDIHIYVEKKVSPTESHWRPMDWKDEPRIYGAFAFLAGVRNYAGIEPLNEPRGIPNDCPTDLREELTNIDYHSHSWFTLAELNAVNWDQLVENRRETREIVPGLISGVCTAQPGQGKMVPLRTIVGEEYIALFKRLASEDFDRVIFAFDN